MSTKTKLIFRKIEDLNKEDIKRISLAFKAICKNRYLIDDSVFSITDHKANIGLVKDCYIVVRKYSNGLSKLYITDRASIVSTLNKLKYRSFDSIEHTCRNFGLFIKRINITVNIK